MIMGKVILRTLVQIHHAIFARHDTLQLHSVCVHTRFRECYESNTVGVHPIMLLLGWVRGEHQVSFWIETRTGREMRKELGR